MVIGIVARDENIHDVDMQVVTRNNIRALHDKASIMGILTYDGYHDNHYEILKHCDGVIIQGGSDIYPYHFDIVNYCMNNNIPILGICMGQQILGLYYGSKDDRDLRKVDNHYMKDGMHIVRTVKDTWINGVLGDEIMVNSRHLYALKDVISPVVVSAYSEDAIIEAIEDINDDHFMVGVQWHPEDLDNMDNLYNAFIKEILKRKIS